MSEQQPLLPVQARRQPTSIWRAKTALLLESRRLHKFIISLIVIDAMCVLADLIYTFLSLGCNPADPHSPQWLEVLAHISFVITILFLIEIPMALWAFGPRYYNPFGNIPHAVLHLFDAAIIVTTFILELVLKGREGELAGMLIVLRLWRLVKLVGGVAVGAGELGEEDARELAETREELEKMKTNLLVLQEENTALRHRLATLEG